MCTVGLITFLLSCEYVCEWVSVFVIIYEHRIKAQSRVSPTLHNTYEYVIFFALFVEVNLLVSHGIMCNIHIKIESHTIPNIETQNRMNLPVTKHLIIFIVAHFSWWLFAQLIDIELIFLPLVIAETRMMQNRRVKEIECVDSRFLAFLWISNENQIEQNRHSCRRLNE